MCTAEGSPYRQQRGYLTKRYIWQKAASLSRTLHVAGATSFASGNPNGKQMFGSLETGDDFALRSDSLVVLFARLDAGCYWQDSTTETSAGNFGLNVAGQSVSSAQTTLGAGLTQIFAVRICR